jgi:glutamyl-tRNA synthetase
MDMTIRARFAPSPTGYLHIGGARTALFSWLYARKHGGNFILRIEDTDLERSTAESVNAILEGMTWLGLEYDEGPFFQTHRFDRYREVIQQLLDTGHAYRCYCTRERLEQLREEQMRQKIKPRYDRFCMDRQDLPEDQPYVIRFKTPREGSIVVHDLIKGAVEFDNNELDDLIIARSDGTPTYNLTVVVDDMDMSVSHVIRGDDHLNNTPRQIHILKALGATPPAYAHVPMILGSDGKRMSKRHGAVSVMQYRTEGFLPEALLNYLVRLGWSHGDQEVFSVDEMIEHFDVSDINKAASTFNPEKLLWLNQQYIKASSPEHIAHQLSWHMGQLGIDPAQGPDLVEIVKTQQDRAKTLVEMASNCAFFYADFTEYEEAAAKKHLKPEALQPLQVVYEHLQGVEWVAEALHGVVSQVAESLQLKMGKVAQPLRVAISGKAATPPIDTTLFLLGREKTLTRMRHAIEHVKQLGST